MNRQLTKSEKMALIFGAIRALFMNSATRLFRYFNVKVHKQAAKTYRGLLKSKLTRVPDWSQSYWSSTGNAVTRHSYDGQ